MSDTPPERNSNSKSNLIEVQHVGVTAKLQSPLKNLLQTSSSTETENGHLLFHDHHGHKLKYDKFTNDTQCETDTATDSKVLYEMRAVRDASTRHPNKRNVTPSKIEFQLYKQPTRRSKRNKCTPSTNTSKRKKPKRKLFTDGCPAGTKCPCHTDTTILQRLRNSLENMRQSRLSNHQQQHSAKSPAPPLRKKTSDKLIDDLPEPCPAHQHHTAHQDASPSSEVRIGIYPFEHGCAEYLRTTDCQPQLLSVVLAERATHYATRFWAEFFGSLHIGVTFLVTFMLQAYRFILYSLVNTLFVGFLHMTSDYLIKPILTVLFNGFLQPPLILVYNILTSVRDLLEPVADTLNNFMRPVATVGKSIRLVHATYNHRKTIKDV